MLELGSAKARNRPRTSSSDVTERPSIFSPCVLRRASPAELHRIRPPSAQKPILAISLELYDDATKTANSTVLRKQWFDETPGTFGALVRGRRVLIVDEVDDTRATLQYAVEELKKTNAPSAIGVLVVHNKLKPKKGTLPPDVTYIAGEHVPNAWNCYPWDAKAYGRDIYEHEKLARQCAGERGLPSWAMMAAAAAAGGACVALLSWARK